MKAEVDEYLAQRTAEGWAPSTIAARREAFTRVLRFLKRRGCRRWADVTPADLDALMADLADRGRRRATKVAMASVLGCFGVWLLESGKVLTNPARDVPIPEDEIPEVPKPPLEEAQVAEILDTLPRRSVMDLRNRALLESVYGCALRRNESVALDLTDIDFGSRTLLVRQGKGLKDRIMPLMAGAMGALRDYLALRRTMLRGPDHGALFLDKNGRRLAGRAVDKWIHGLSRRYPHMPRFHTHLFRHSIAVHLLRRGADIRHVQEFLGHALLDTTKVYLRMVPGHLKDDYDAAMPEIDVRL